MLRVQRDHDARKLRPLALVNRQYIRQRQLVESAKPYLTVVRLTEICRQASQSRIVTAALRSLDIKRLQSRVESSRSGLGRAFGRARTLGRTLLIRTGSAVAHPVKRPASDRGCVALRNGFDLSCFTRGGRNTHARHGNAVKDFLRTKTGFP